MVKICFNVRVLIIANNKKAFFEYEILEKLEAGLVLTGSEAKSLRTGKVSLQGAFVRVLMASAAAKKPEVFLVNANFSGADEPDRPRKLLLNRKEINRLMGKSLEKNLAIVPLKFYLTGRGLAKVEIAITRGLKKHDKRERIKQKHQKRNLEREGL